MASALETLCGQAFGAKKYHMLGVYLQRSWLVLLAFAVLLTPTYVLMEDLLLLIGQPADLASLAGRMSVWLLPQHFAMAMLLPLTRFLQSQLKNWVTAATAGVALALHVVITYLVLLLLIYSLENWYYRVLVLLTGYLKNAEIAVDALSICLTINGWEMMIPFGFLAATGRCSQASPNPRATEVARTARPSTSHGVAIGSGWQALVAYVNVGSYYLVGVPLGAILGWPLNFGVGGIWSGLIGGTAVQTLVLAYLTVRCDWDEEAKKASTRMEVWASTKK
uniref:Protein DETOXIFICATION n=1 Tax=Oryza brachyantha TaxID=4533 RepID=J3MTV4_ORYBR